MSIAGRLDVVARHQETLTWRDSNRRWNPWRILKNGDMLLLVASAWALPVLAQTTSGAQSPAINAGGNVAVTYGLTPEQVQDLIKAARAGDADKIADLSGKLGVTQGAAATMLRIIGEQDVPLEKLPQKLAEVAERYKSATERLAALDTQDPITRDLIERADAAIKAGQLDDADQLVGQAALAEVAAARQARKLALQAQAAADQRLLRAAADGGVRGSIAMTRLDYLAAARAFQEAVDLVPAGHPDEKGQLLFAEADALYRQGDDRGENISLVNSIATYRLALQEDNRDRVPLQWAMIQNNLGNALSALGQHDSGTTRLEEAVAVYRAALEEETRERVPLDWAMTQMNLGSALTTLGERESGTAHLEEAVIAYRAALEERTRERVPLDWAMTQNNLGCALQRLGERESGSARLEEAVAVYRTALEERTRERVPLDWAKTQNNIGNALLRLAERGGGTARLEEAAAAYRLALQERARKRVPLQWAETQNNLGVVLRTLGEQDSGTARLEEAVVAYRAALEERTRERVPLDWAMTQNNLGIALRTLGEREGGTARLDEAVAAYRAALEEYTPDRVPLQWAQTQMNLANALQTLGARESGTARLEEAIGTYRATLVLDKLPLDQAMAQFNMGLALTILGNRTHNMDPLKKALLCFRQACAVFRAAGMMQLSTPCDRAIIPLQNNLEPSAPRTGKPPKPSG